MRPILLDKNSNSDWELLLTRKNRNLQSTSGTFCKPAKIKKKANKRDLVKTRENKNLRQYTMGTSGNVCEPAKNENSNDWDLLLTREKLKLYKQNYNGTKK